MCWCQTENAIRIDWRRREWRKRIEKREKRELGRVRIEWRRKRKNSMEHGSKLLNNERSKI
jgi:hypothetical protein